MDAGAILAAMGRSARAQVSAIGVAASSVSTQADALAALAPTQGCAVFLAEHQTAGQGRRGRGWVSAPAGGSLAMSVSRRFRVSLAMMSGLSLVAGIAVAEALELDGVGLKWPNDLVAGGLKLGGILVNLRTPVEGACDAVVGIGLNLALPAAAGEAIDQPWTDLARLAGAVPPRALLVARLLDRLLPAFQEFEAGGLRPFLARWQRLDALDGRPVRILDGPRVHEGVSAGITETGALRLSRAGGGEGEGERVFASGEVSLRPA
jgi:BirA family biotin operon repressor/biotin-[acetyl-CoA-carboxylase] ligase